MNMPIATSISMEGKEFWIIRTLPISAREYLKGKLRFNIGLIAPFFLVGELIMIIALKPSVLELLWMIALPVAIIMCILVVGLAVNLRFPKLKWDSEVEVVKQSASGMIGGLGGFLIALVATIPLVLVPDSYFGLVACVEFVVVVALTVIVYEKNNRVDMKNFE